MFFDTHVHLCHEAFCADRAQVIDQADAFLECATSLEDISWVLLLSKEYAKIFAAVGIHPFYCTNLSNTEGSIGSLLQRLCAQNVEIKAIGEIGLDYRKNQPDHKMQYACFLEQLEAAKKLQLPVSIHCVQALPHVQEAIRSSGTLRGILHGVSLSRESAAFFLDRDFYFGIGSIATYANARRILELIAYMPIDHLLLETDSPYMPPKQARGERNVPANARYTAQVIAEIKQMSLEEVFAITYQNACNLLQVEKA